MAAITGASGHAATAQDGATNAGSGDTPSRRRRAPRSDGRRSVEKILAATEKLLARDGLSVSLEEVAREAGVASTTLYRHFPSRMHLLEALHRGHVTRVADEANRLQASEPPFTALTMWLEEFVTLGLELQGGLALLLSEGLKESDPVSNARWGRTLLTEAARTLLDNAQQAGVVRRDIGAPELVFLLGGIVRAVVGSPASTPENRRATTAQLLLDVVIDGLVAGVHPSDRARERR
ncbi:TetR/AcrR family transcriptional regulator [Pseudonocardia ailaonensis]|uniref:TetR/AcrR family transcriptional regulator n=1 Tax=Pseudonocardia ailaonensis TaxID=367279 RepID=A0ABN2N572_9PSEU